MTGPAVRGGLSGHDGDMSQLTSSLTSPAPLTKGRSGGSGTREVGSAPAVKKRYAAAAVMPKDAYRSGDTFIVELDLPGVDADSIDLTVERNVLNVTPSANLSGRTVSRRSSPSGPTACSAGSCSSATPWMSTS